MNDTRLNRKLAAVMAADMVGYSKRMEADEAGTLALTNQIRVEVFEPLIEEFNGRLIKLMGDGLLAEFGSVVDAVNCAISIQNSLPELTLEDTNSDSPQYRIGINLGDVIQENGDLFGDGVNIAARLEQLAEPGGICISGTVYDHLKSNVKADYQSLGEVQVKNLSQPVRAYQVLTRSDQSRLNVRYSRLGKSPVRPLSAFLVLLVVLGVGAISWSSINNQFEPVNPTSMDLELPDRPSIAVLPFANLSDDQDQEYFADGITDDLITDLSKVSGLFVIARNSAFVYERQQGDVRQVAKDLGVRYVLEGSVRRANAKVRINAQLADATTGGQIWADRYDGEASDIFSLQDEVTRQIVSVLAVQLTQDEEAKVMRRSTSSADAYDAFLLGWEGYLRQTPESLQAAIGSFEEAVEIDPNYGRAYAALAAAYWQISRRFWHAEFDFRTPHDARLKAEEMLKAAEADPSALMYQVSTSMLSQQGWHERALAAGAQAIGIDPNDADSYIALAGALNLAGKPEEAEKLVEKAMRLNPYYPQHYLYQLGLAEFGLGNFRDAATALEKAITLNPDDRFAYRVLIAAYGHLNQSDKIERIIETANKSWLGHDPLTIRATIFWFPFQEAADRDRFINGLRAAGLPE
jgi:adenylate cyclase